MKALNLHIFHMEGGLTGLIDPDRPFFRSQHPIRSDYYRCLYVNGFYYYFNYKPPKRV